MTKQESKFAYILLGLVLFLVGSILTVGAISKLKYGGSYLNFTLGFSMIIASVFIFIKKVK